MFNTFNRLHAYARWVLACMVLALGVSVASPLVSPQSMELVCSAVGGMKLIQKMGDGGQPLTGHALDCPLCIPMAPPPPMVVPAVAQPQPLAHASHWVAMAHIAARLGPPLPPRGPPILLKYY
jgi:hypothetical protein